MLIVIEGIDGAGKATQTRLLVERFRREKYRVETLDFPRYEQNFFGQLVRRYLRGEFGTATEVNPYLASALYAFDRWESSAQIQEWLDSGCAVVLDRYVGSNLIHQTVKVPATEQAAFTAWLLTMEYRVLKLPKPDCTLYLHLPFQVARDLIQQRSRSRDGHEKSLAHLEAAARQCQRLAKEFDWESIACTDNGKLLTPEAIHQKAWGVVQKKIQLPRSPG